MDVETRHGGLDQEHAPPTLTVRTPSGGFHPYFQVAGEVGNSVRRLGPGIDVRGERGYVGAPPSPGWSFYNELPMARVDPGSFAGAVRSGRMASSGCRVGWEPFEPPGHVPEGQRNATLARYAGLLYRMGLDPERMAEVLLDYNAVAVTPPLGEDEFRRVPESIARYHVPEGLGR